jgi:hypothetical protein
VKYNLAFKASVNVHIIAYLTCDDVGDLFLFVRLIMPVYVIRWAAHKRLDSETIPARLIKVSRCNAAPV